MLSHNFGIQSAKILFIVWKGLTPKVFRTYNISVIFQELLEEILQLMGPKMSKFRSTNGRIVEWPNCYKPQM